MIHEGEILAVYFVSNFLNQEAAMKKNTKSLNAVPDMENTHGMK